MIYSYEIGFYQYNNRPTQENYDLDSSSFFEIKSMSKANLTNIEETVSRLWIELKPNKRLFENYWRTLSMLRIITSQVNRENK